MHIQFGPTYFASYFYGNFILRYLNNFRIFTKWIINKQTSGRRGSLGSLIISMTGEEYDLTWRKLDKRHEQEIDDYRG